ncbi:chlorophyll(ide) b reductase [Pycnococcus provasolii]
MSVSFPSLLGGLVLGASLAHLPSLLRYFLEGRVSPDTSRSRSRRVIITGGTRGLGFAMAREFLALGDSVTVCGRDESAVTEAAESLGCHAVQCDVSDYRDVDRLFESAEKAMGGPPDLVLNNAALSQSPKMRLVDMAVDGQLRTMVDANMTGALIVARRAIPALASCGGTLFFMDGTGAWGNATPGNSVYGCSKRGITQLAATLRKEVTEQKLAQVGVHMASPGMVNTRLLRGAVDFSRTSTVKVLSNLVAEPAEVASWLVPRLRGVPCSCSGRMRYIRFLTPFGAAYRLLFGAMGMRKPTNLMKNVD